MTDTQVAMPAELFRVPVVDLCNIHQQDSLLGDPTERNARNGLGISTQGAIPALHSALAQHAAQSDIRGILLTSGEQTPLLRFAEQSARPRMAMRPCSSYSS